jgi:hypothetical protein
VAGDDPHPLLKLYQGCKFAATTDALEAAIRRAKAVVGV